MDKWTDGQAHSTPLQKTNVEANTTMKYKFHMKGGLMCGYIL